MPCSLTQPQAALGRLSSFLVPPQPKPLSPATTCCSPLSGHPDSALHPISQAFPPYNLEELAVSSSKNPPASGSLWNLPGEGRTPGHHPQAPPAPTPEDQLLSSRLHALTLSSKHCVLSQCHTQHSSQPQGLCTCCGLYLDSLAASFSPCCMALPERPTLTVPV